MYIYNNIIVYTIEGLIYCVEHVHYSNIIFTCINLMYGGSSQGLALGYSISIAVTPPIEEQIKKNVS